MRRRPVTALFLVAGMFATACASDAADVDSAATTSDDTNERPPVFRYPPAPEAPAADVADAPEVRAAMDRLGTQLRVGAIDDDALADVVEYGDARHAWYVADVIRFFGPGETGDELVDAFETLTGTSIADDPDSERNVWLSTTNHLIAWDTPAYPDYRADKADLFLLVEERWAPFFGDEDPDIDWRHLSWGGVLIDDRELGDTDGCSRGCIPALDDPAVTDAAGGDWYPDDAVVFGIVEGDEALAIPKNIAEIHEMFNLTLGDRRFGIPYCTLCGSAQAYRTDDAVAAGGAAEVPVLRTSGLLSRSNKVMYDLRTRSVFDTFTGAAVSGPLQDRGIVLEETTVVRTTWGEWKQAHPATTIIAEDGGIGRTYPLDPLQGRDDHGPIFPIGPADDRLGVQELVVGVITDGDTPVAFPAGDARAALASGEEVEAAGVELVGDGGGLRAVDAATGESIASHESFWFAWSQFHPSTELWRR
jgi:hypothetical protein